MKRWQLEQILYLNDLNKSKLVLPETPEFKISRSSTARDDRENIFLRAFRRLFAFIINAL